MSGSKYLPRSASGHIRMSSYNIFWLSSVILASNIESINDCRSMVQISTLAESATIVNKLFVRFIWSFSERLLYSISAADAPFLYFLSAAHAPKNFST